MAADVEVVALAAEVVDAAAGAAEVVDINFCQIIKQLNIIDGLVPHMLDYHPRPGFCPGPLLVFLCKICYNICKIYLEP